VKSKRLNMDPGPSLGAILLELAQADTKFCDLYHAEDWDEFEAHDIFLNQQTPFLTRDSRFIKIRNKGISLFQSESRHYCTQLERHRLKNKREFPPMWIKTNKGIWINLNKKKNRHFLSLYEILMDSRITPGEKANPVLVKPDYDLIEQKLKIMKKQVDCYLREMQRWEIIKRDHREGEGGPWFYSLGIWMQGKNRTPRPIYFLKETPEMKHALIHFDASRQW
jgi:hypothetical protein